VLLPPSLTETASYGGQSPIVGRREGETGAENPLLQS